MLQRKVMARLKEWKANKTHQGLLIMGARQVGKTTVVHEFAKTHYDTILEINFLENPRAASTIAEATDADDLMLRIRALAGVAQEGSTLIFLDEIQVCEDILTWIKFLIERNDCDFILSGSLLGVEGLSVRSLPVGFLEVLTMYPMDFEEFSWSQGVDKTLWDKVQECFRRKTSVPDYLHEMLMGLFYKYLLVGGMPDAVQAFVDRNDLQATRQVQRNIRQLYLYDISKYVKDTVESRQIRMVYEAIPAQLNAPTKRFKYTRLGKNLRFASLENAFDWLDQAGVAISVSRVSDPEFPLGLYEDRNRFKLFMSDVGLLTSQLTGSVDLDILDRKSAINFGSIFENVAAQEFLVHGFEPHYYANKGVGEVDFVLQKQNGGIGVYEIKSGKDYTRHSALRGLLSTKNYQFDDVAVFCDGNVSKQEGITYLPVYMMALIED